MREMQRLTGAVIKLPEQVPNLIKMSGNVIIKLKKASPSTAGHLDWRGDKCAHHWTFLLHPICSAADPCDGSRAPRRSSPHSGPPPPQWRRGRHLAHATSLLRRRAADTLVDVEPPQNGCLRLRSRPPHPRLPASSNRNIKEATIGIKTRH